MGGVDAGSGYLRLCSIVAASLRAQEVAGKPGQDPEALFICLFFFVLFLYFSTSVSFSNDVFFVQHFSGWQLPPVPHGGQELQQAVLGQFAAETGRGEGEQSEAGSRRSVQQE